MHESSQGLDVAEAQRELVRAFQEVQATATSADVPRSSSSPQVSKQELTSLLIDALEKSKSPQPEQCTPPRSSAAQQRSPPDGGHPGSAPTSGLEIPVETTKQQQQQSRGSSKTSHHSSRRDIEHFRVKWIVFLGEVRPILMQSDNGPCPFLAICNILLLKGKVTLPRNKSQVSFDELVEVIANLSLQLVENDFKNMATEDIIEGCIRILPKLNEGMDVNVYFDNVDKFEFTEELGVLDVLNIRLLHGWICAEDDTAFAAVRECGSYNRLVEKILYHEDLQGYVMLQENLAADPVGKAEEIKQSMERLKTQLGEIPEGGKLREALSEGALLRSWNDRTASQLTYIYMIQD